MPIIVGCPNCAGQLRVADGLIGRKVRCPACNTIFDAAEPAAPPPPPRDEPAGSTPLLPKLELPVETERVDPWKALNLELTPSEPARPPKEEPKPKPKGVREPGPTPEEDDEPRRPRKARLNDDHDDLRPCPGCGRMVYRDSRRCIACGERLAQDDDPDDDIRYERRRRKRDWEPHRSGFVLTMGVISLATPFACWPLSFLAVIPGIMAWAMGSGDLRKMRRGEMDPDGQGNTQAGWICGIIGTLINGLVVLGCGAVFGFVWIVDVQHNKNRPRPGFNPPPPIVRPK